MKRKFVILTILIAVSTIILLLSIILQRNKQPQTPDIPQSILFPTGIKPQKSFWIDEETILLTTKHSVKEYDTQNRISEEIYHTDNNITDISSYKGTYYIIEQMSELLAFKSITPEEEPLLISEFPKDLLVQTYDGNVCTTKVREIASPTEISSEIDYYSRGSTRPTKTHRFSKTLTPAWCSETPPLIPAFPFLLPEIFTLDQLALSESVLKKFFGEEKVLEMKFNPPAIGIHTTSSLTSILYNEKKRTFETIYSQDISDSIPAWGIGERGAIVIVHPNNLTVHTETETIEIPFEDTAIEFVNILPNERFTRFALTDSTGYLYILQRQ